MNVGIYIGSSNPEIGGGFTFEDEVFRGLLELKSECRHTLVVLGNSPTPPPALVGSNFQYVSLTEPPPTSYRERIREKLRRLGQTKVRRHRNEIARQASFAQRRLSDCGIELIFSLVPWQVPDLEIPFISLVWDLMHRTHPFFPEVSAGGVWQARDRVFQSILPRATFVVAGTQTGKNEIHSFYRVAPEKIRILPHPTPRFALEADVDRHPAVDELQTYSLPEEFIFYPAQFWPHKNHVALLEALHLLQTRHRVRMALVCTGSDQGNEAFIRAKIQALGLEGQVHRLGFVSRSVLIALYRRAFALTYVSFGGPENLPPLEAFALGCPVVAARVAGAEEQLGEAACLVDPKNPESIADALWRLKKDPGLRQRYAELGKLRAKRFTVQDFVRGTYQMFDEFEPYRRSWGR